MQITSPNQVQLTRMLFKTKRVGGGELKNLHSEVVPLHLTTSSSNPAMYRNNSFCLHVFTDSSFLELSAVLHGGPAPNTEMEVGKKNLKM